ncbi:uncharacterized protein DUF4325 [Leptospira meyeri]|uniref:Uncharacterized protein DUF4325 n=1 Tax=Leptospira meyeri TaxID=29508 RepID=A0A4R8MWL5_LEPME|nr:STAS-like domain-containing protein [Leptospira meyeri]EKJ85530.1 PF14213 domain protein [Leptospira meyeri serovar Hardjo str. Went 5]TDY71346.1 uncharacterized protein DUF4325 [Leptospira meyeri]
MNKVINVKDFSEFPGLRHCKISANSGEEFYHKVLNSEFKKAIDNNFKLIINIDNTAGYAPSFLDEAFGNLIFDFSLEEVKKRLEIISHQEPDLKIMIEKETFEQWEKRRINNQKPKKTIKHKKWFRKNYDSIIEVEN